ncbi:putative pectinesterase 52 isoform X2 [Diospyros lotus]|uniref:putative pectinesterase 52 isoform X2 n=1 Tax=Diospyros lotus TaxID=55363 RepID=UPI0022522701|nr:putative pectinesterase 52 isoform X2 [Diospyros lotus]
MRIPSSLINQGREISLKFKRQLILFVLAMISGRASMLTPGSTSTENVLSTICCGCREHVEIPMGKPCILLEGSGLSQTIITGDGHAQTNSSATFTVSSNNFVAKRIAFENSYNRGAAVDSITEWEPAVAASVYGDKMAFHECAFLGFQDTLWDVQGRHYFNSCHIEGAVDFIWGSGQSVFEDCAINVTAGLLPKGVLAGFITAQGRQSATDPSGFVFIRGTVSGIGEAFLGRAYGPFSRVIYHGTTLEAVVAPAGWNAWKYQDHVKNFVYVEVDCGGPGADKSKRVPWETKSLSYSELQAFSRERFIDQDGWIGNQLA